MILETMYSIPAFAFVAVVVMGWYITSLFRERMKLAKLGAKPVALPYKIPFGWDTLWEILQVCSVLRDSEYRLQASLKISTLCERIWRSLGVTLSWYFCAERGF